MWKTMYHHLNSISNTHSETELQLGFVQCFMNWTLFQLCDFLSALVCMFLLYTHAVTLYSQVGLGFLKCTSVGRLWRKKFVVSKFLWAAQVISASGALTQKQAAYVRWVTSVCMVSITHSAPVGVVYWEMPIAQLEWVQFNINFYSWEGLTHTDLTHIFMGQTLWLPLWPASVVFGYWKQGFLPRAVQSRGAKKQKQKKHPKISFLL